MKRIDQVYDSNTLQRALWGKSHYADDDTRRYFRARYCGEVLQASFATGSNGGRTYDRFVYFAESSAAGFEIKDGRVYRAVRIDLTSGRVEDLDATGRVPKTPAGRTNAGSAREAVKRVRLAYSARQKVVARRVAKAAKLVKVAS